jgi:hypothetical protein
MKLGVKEKFIIDLVKFLGLCKESVEKGRIVDEEKFNYGLEEVLPYVNEKNPAESTLAEEIEEVLGEIRDRGLIDGFC